VDGFNSCVVPMRENFAPPARFRDRSAQKAEVYRILVGPHPEKVILVLDKVLHARLARLNEPEVSHGILGVEKPELRRRVACDVESKKTGAASAVDADIEAGVGFFEYEHVRLLRRQLMPPEAMRPFGFIKRCIEESEAVRTPGGVIVNTADRFCQEISGQQA